MRACKNCRYGDRADDNGATFYWCRLLPPRPQVMEGGKIEAAVPPMKPDGWCGQFRLSFWRWVFGSRK